MRKDDVEEEDAMSEETWSAIDDYFVESLLPYDADLEWALASSDAAGLPKISVTANQGRFLALLATLNHSSKILEIGTLGGYSTIWLARALLPGGRLTTLEADAHHAVTAEANIKRAGLGDVVDLRLGKAIDLLPVLEAENAGPYDFIFIDADKASMPDYYDWAVRLSRPGTVIVCDNVVRNGQVLEPNHEDPDVQGVRRFFEKV
ncbi:MAG: O-methyltransferase, partial [Armatimonadota bacterium]